MRTDRANRFMVIESVASEVSDLLTMIETAAATNDATRLRPIQTTAWRANDLLAGLFPIIKKELEGEE